MKSNESYYSSLSEGVKGTPNQNPTNKLQHQGIPLGALINIIISFKKINMVTVSNYALRVRKDGSTFVVLELTGGLEIIQSSIAQSVKLHRKSFFVRMARFIKTKNENQCKSRFQKKQPELLREIFVPEVIRAILIA